MALPEIYDFARTDELLGTPCGVRVGLGWGHGWVVEAKVSGGSELEVGLAGSCVDAEK